jgi:hypothetical protein
VDVHDVGSEVADEVVQGHRRLDPRLEARAHVDRAGRAEAEVGLPYDEALLVLCGEAAEDPQQPRVRPAAVGEPVGEVQRPHGGQHSPGRPGMTRDTGAYNRPLSLRGGSE